MKQLFLSLCLCGGLMPAMAQEKFIDGLTKPVTGQGTVRVVQDAVITQLVNGTAKEPASTPVPQTGNKNESPAEQAKRPTRKMKANGYRIQVYAGGNSRTARQEAQQMAGICRVGDFRTYEEASQFLRELKATEQFDEALIVRSVIQIPY